MKFFALNSAAWRSAESQHSIHLLVTRGYFLDTNATCVFVTLEYAPELSIDGKPRWVGASVTFSTPTVDPVTVQVDESGAQASLLLCEQKVIYQSLTLVGENRGVEVRQYFGTNSGLTVLRVEDLAMAPLLKRVPLLQLGPDYLDDLALATRPVTTWPKRERDRVLR